MRLIATMVLLGCLAVAQSTTPAAAPKADDKKMSCCCCGDMAKGDKMGKMDHADKDKKGDGCCGGGEGSMCARKPMKDDKPAEKK